MKACPEIVIFCASTELCYSGTKLKGSMGLSHPPNFERAKTAVQCSSAGQLTGPRAIGQPLLLEKGHRQEMFASQPLITPKNCYPDCSS